MLVDAQGGEERSEYGNYIIKKYSKKLICEIGKGYSVTSLKYMRQFYLFQKGQPLVDQLTWSHYTILLPLKDKEKFEYYKNQVIINHLSKRELRNRIKLNEYERLDNKTKLKLITNEENKIEDFIKNPIVLKSNINKDKITEKLLHNLILENMDNFL